MITATKYTIRLKHNHRDPEIPHNAREWQIVVTVKNHGTDTPSPLCLTIGEYSSPTEAREAMEIERNAQRLREIARQHIDTTGNPPYYFSVENGKKRIINGRLTQHGAWPEHRTIKPAAVFGTQQQQKKLNPTGYGRAMIYDGDGRPIFLLFAPREFVPQPEGPPHLVTFDAHITTWGRWRGR